MKKIAAGLFVATSLVALSACQKTATPNAADNAAASTNMMAESNAAEPVANGSGSAADSSGGEENSTMAGNNATASNSTDPHGASGGH